MSIFVLMFIYTFLKYPSCYISYSLSYLWLYNNVAISHAFPSFLSLNLSLILRPTASQPVCLRIKHPSAAYYRNFITVRQLRMCWCVTLSLWREDGSVVYNCCWPSPAQSFSGPSPMGLVTIFYSLRFETSLFVASYDSQGYGGGIRPRLHTG
jgi:hypothetical protein